MEDLLTRHRKEQRDLIARTTQKKKGATKKTRKSVNDECAALERDTQERHKQELAELAGESSSAPLQDANNKDDGSVSEEQKEEEENGTESSAVALSKLGISEKKEEEQREKEGEEGQDRVESQQQQQQQRKPNRQKARLARRAAEQEALATQAAAEAASMPDMRQVERSRMETHLTQHGLCEKEIRADGHCLYSAVADQMEQLGLRLVPGHQQQKGSEVNGSTTSALKPASSAAAAAPYKTVRRHAADFMETHPDDFVPFLEEPLPGYLHKVRDTGEWGGHMELMALANAYGVRINVLHGDGRIDEIENRAEDKGQAQKKDANGEEKEKVLWLGYYRHGFGLGEHYNSLRKKP